MTSQGEATQESPAGGRLAFAVRDRDAVLAFATLGAAVLAAYAVFWLVPLWLGSLRPFSGGAQSITSLLGADYQGLVRFIAAILVPIVLYISGLLVLPLVPHRPALIIAGAVTILAPLVLLYAYPALAADIFDYLLSARIFAHYHLTPYVHVRAQFPGDVYFPPTGFRDLPDNYGPAWLWLSSLPVLIAGSHAVLGLVLMKLLAVLGHVGTAAFVYLIVRRIDPRRAVFALVAYGWNPLAVVYFGVDGHNDAIMLLFVVAAFYFAQRREWEVSLPLLTLGVLVKWTPAILVPFFLLQARKDGVRPIAGLGISAGLVIALFFPLWAGTSTFDGVRDQGSKYFSSSPASMVSFVVAHGLLRPAAAVLFGAGYLAIVRLFRGLPERCFAVLVLYYVVLSFWQRGWYLTWALAFGAILGGDALWISAVAGILSLFNPVFGGWGWQMDWLRWQSRWGSWMMELWLTTCMYLGWLVGAVWLLGRWLRERASGGRPRFARP